MNIVQTHRPVLHLHPHSMVIDHEGVAPFEWPVSIEATIAARDQFARAAMAHVRAENVDASADAEALWLALPHLVPDFCYIFQCVAAGLGLGRRWQVEFGEAALIAADLPIGVSPRIEFARTLPRGQPIWRKPLRMAKMLISSGQVVSKPPFAIDPEHDIVTFQLLPNLVRQARKEGVRRVVISRFDDWMSAASPADDRRQAGMSATTAEAYRQILTEAFLAGGTPLGTQVTETLMQSADIIIRRIQSQVEQLRRNEKQLPKEFWSGTGGNLMNRVFGRMVSRCGGRVTAFDHGMSTGLWDSWAQTLLEFNWADRFITFSDAMAAGLRHNYTADYMGREDHVCQILAASDPEIGEMQTSADSNSVERRVLYVPTLYAGRSTQIIPLLPDIVAVDWQARLFNFLSTEGWDIGFKAHPESYCLPPDAFGQFGIKFEAGLFEGLKGSNATLIFDYPQSTAFRSALTSTLPIIFVDLPRLPLQAGVRDLLARRCAVVRGWFDKDNRVQVDWADLRRALALAPQLTGDKTVRDTLFPGAMS